MQQDDLHEIFSLPTKYRESDLSWHELVLRSPYSTNQDRFTEDHLASFLKDHSDFIGLWVSFSADKRSTPSAFLRKSGQRYEVGYVERGGSLGSSEFYDEPAQACARFILRDLAA